MNTDRVPPHSLDAEKSLLGAILSFPQALLDVAGLVTAGEFYRQAHQRIFAACERLGAAGEGVDLVTVVEALRAAGELAEVGGPAYVAGLMTGIPRSSNVPHYAGLVREKAKLRQIIHGATLLLADAYADDEPAQVVLDRAEQHLFALCQGAATEGFRSMGVILPGVLEQLEAWASAKTGLTGVPSGFTDLDAMTRGFQPGNLIILAARPGMGKSACVVNIAQHAAGLGKSVGIFSLEMSAQEIGVRALTAAAHVDGHRLQQGRIYGSEWDRIAAAVTPLSDLKLYIDDAPFVTAFEMRSRARRLKAEHGLDLLIVDYTQLMVGDADARRENRTIELAGITRALKGLAKDLQMPVIALSQLSRKVEERADKRPMLSDLRESGSLEQDADVVIFIYREAVYQATPENAHLAELIVGKQRNGPIGTVRVGWRPEETRFVNLSEVGE